MFRPFPQTSTFAEFEHDDFETECKYEHQVWNSDKNKCVCDKAAGWKWDEGSKKCVQDGKGNVTEESCKARGLQFIKGDKPFCSKCASYDMVWEPGRTKCIPKKDCDAMGASVSWSKGYPECGCGSGMIWDGTKGRCAPADGGCILEFWDANRKKIIHKFTATPGKPYKTSGGLSGPKATWAHLSGYGKCKARVDNRDLKVRDWYQCVRFDRNNEPCEFSGKTKGISVEFDS